MTMTTSSRSEGNGNSYVVKGSDFPSELVEEKCMSKYLITSKKKNKQVFDMAATGDRKTNLMLSFLQCQLKVTKTCLDQEKEYTSCHKSFMGVGSYKGRRHCGDKMMSLYNCLQRQQKD
jgi:hypothetical protein